MKSPKLILVMVFLTIANITSDVFCMKRGRPANDSTGKAREKKRRKVVVNDYTENELLQDLFPDDMDLIQALSNEDFERAQGLVKSGCKISPDDLYRKLQDLRWSKILRRVICRKDFGRSSDPQQVVNAMLLRIQSGDYVPESKRLDPFCPFKRFKSLYEKVRRIGALKNPKVDELLFCSARARKRKPKKPKGRQQPSAAEEDDWEIVRLAGKEDENRRDFYPGVEPKTLLGGDSSAPGPVSKEKRSAFFDIDDFDNFSLPASVSVPVPVPVPALTENQDDFDDFEEIDLPL